MKILSCGAGMQSTALTLMSCENAKKSNKWPLVPVYDAVIFCDLGGEANWVYDQVKFMQHACGDAGIPFYILNEKNLYDDYIKNFGTSRVVTIPFWSIDENGKKGKLTRHCTIDYKILQIQKFFRWTLLGYKKGQHIKSEDVQAHEMHIGFSLEEKHRIFDSKHKMFINKFPLVEMGIERKDNYAYVRDVWGLETKASACLMCPFHTNYFFEYIKQYSTTDYEKVLVFDDLLENNKKIRQLEVKYIYQEVEKELKTYNLRNARIKNALNIVVKIYGMDFKYKDRDKL